MRRWRIRGEWRSGIGSEERGEAGDCKARDEGEEAGGQLMRRKREGGARGYHAVGRCGFAPLLILAGDEVALLALVVWVWETAG